ncbi:hypothetical protein ACVWY5_005045 [Bradyrhizobium sp. USDA 3256]
MHGSSFPPASLSQGLGPKRSLAVTITNILGTGDVVAAAGALCSRPVQDTVVLRTFTVALCNDCRVDTR